MAIATLAPGAASRTLYAASDDFPERLLRVQTLRANGKHARVLQEIPGLLEAARAGADPDLYLCFAYGEVVHAWVNLGAPDRAEEARREMFDALKRLEARGAAPPAATLSVASHDVAWRCALEDFEGAVETLDRALEKAAALSPEPDLIAIAHAERALAAFGLARRDHDELPRAIERLREAMASLADSPRNSGLRLQVQARLVTALIESGAVAAAEEALLDAEREVAGALGAGGSIELEIARARVVLARARDEGPSPGAGEILDARERLERTLEDVLAGYADIETEGGVGILHFDRTRNAVSELIRLDLLAGESALHALDRVLEAQRHSTLARLLDADRVTAGELLASVESLDDHLVLCYLPASWRSHLFAISNSGVRHHELESGIALKPLRDRLARFLDRTLSAQDVDSLRDAGEEAARAMLPPGLSGELDRCRRVTICAVAALQTMPFEFLRRAGGAPLFETHDLAFTPSLPVLARLGTRLLARAPGLRPSVRVLAATSPSDLAAKRFPSLAERPIDGFRWNRVARVWPNDMVEFFSGGEATRSRICDPSGGILQIFAHGVYDATRLRPAALALAPETAEDDGLFSSEDLDSCPVPPLVVLGACGASAGPYRGGDEGAQSLAGAFLAAGAATVVASARPIDAQATCDLATRFHEHLARGRSPAEALRRARGDTPLREGARFVSWRAVGWAHAPVLAEPVRADDSPAALWTGLAATALLGLWLYARSRRRESD